MSGTKEFEILKVGIVGAQVCTSLPSDEAERRMNAEHPTGIASDWEITLDPAPVPCANAPETHTHYIMRC